jgi:hypothetical protein
VSELAKHKHMTHTGFVPDEKVYLYYSAADLVVMPYEVFMSASGPFSRALAHQKPIILSEKLKDYTKSEDFKTAMQKAQVTQSDLYFSLSKKSLLTHVF